VRDTLRWGILGAAQIGRAYVIPALMGSANGRVTAIASRERSRAVAAAAEFGIPRAHASYDALLADPDVDAVYNPLPNALHAEWTIRAAQAGKHVLCEKPFATTTDEALQMTEACRTQGVALMEAVMYRFHPQHVRVRELIASGAIGEVHEVRAGLSIGILGSAERDNIRFEPAVGGGALLDMGFYPVDATRMLMGANPVHAVAWRDFDDTLGIDVSLAGVLEFPGRRFATISCSFKAGDNTSYVVVGSTGTIEVPRAFIPGYGTRVGDTVVIVMDEQWNRREEHFAPANHYRLMAEAFAAAVLAGRPVPYPPEESIANMRALDALARAAATNALEAVG
jgi:xylose dehydrogenase (NAD/NADP)